MSVLVKRAYAFFYLCVQARPEELLLDHFIALTRHLHGHVDGNIVCGEETKA